MNEPTITKRTAQRNLTLMWAGFTGVLTMVFFMQTVIGDKYGEQSDEVWNWFIPMVFPTLTLMIGALVSVVQSTEAGQKNVDKFYYHLTIGFISVYFLFLLVTVFTAPLAFMNSETPAFDHLKKSALPLNALQTLVTAVLGFFFFKENEGK